MRSKMLLTARVMICVILVLVALASVGGCAKPTLGERVVYVGNLTDMTGPCAPELIPLSRGTAAYFDYLNKTGGIDGTKVEVLWVDSKYELATALAGYERLKGKCIAFWSPMTHALTALKETAARDKIPIQGQTSVTVPFWPPGYLLGSGVTYGEGLTLIAAFLQEGWKETRPIRVALMFSDDTYGRTIYDGGVQRLKEMGIEIVAEEPVLMRATDATSQLLRVAAENPDYIFCNFIAATQGVVLKDRYRLGIKIPVCTAHGSWAEDLVKMAGVEACEGVISARPFPVPEEADLWGCKLRDEIIRDYLPEWAGKPVGVGAGVNTGIIIAEAIRLAQKEVGFDKLTGESLLKFGFERIKDLDTGGLNPPGLTYTPEDHQGSKYNRLIRIVNGEPVVIKGWTEVPRCMAGVSAK